MEDFDVIEFLSDSKLNKTIFYPDSCFAQDLCEVKIDESCSLFCKYIKAKDSDRTVVMFYGNGESVAEYEESRLVDAITTRFNCNCFIAEYRGYGKSTGEMSFVNMISDVKKIMASLEMDENRIIVFGRSMGGFPLIESIFQCPNVAGVIVESAHSSLSGFIQKRKGLTGEQKAKLDDFFNFEEKIKNFHGSVLLIHAVDDDIVPYFNCEILQELFSKQTQNITTLSGLGGHNNIFVQNHKKYLQHVGEFLNNLK